jgi:hypothetical protein
MEKGDFEEITAEFAAEFESLKGLAVTPPKPFITPITFSFELRESDTLNETGIAVLNHNDVLGWIKKEDIHKLPVDKLSGVILTVELFIWAAGGGQCARGTLLINHGTDCFPYDQLHA